MKTHSSQIHVRSSQKLDHVSQKCMDVLFMKLMKQMYFSHRKRYILLTLPHSTAAVTGYPSI